MTKPFIITIFVLMISYVILENIVEIPKLLNNMFYGIITLLAIYFLKWKQARKLVKDFEKNQTKLFHKMKARTR